jgi:membrane-associated PAP2 superfamily phosphatase
VAFSWCVQHRACADPHDSDSHFHPHRDLRLDLGRDILIALSGLACLLVWDASAGDLAMARWFGTRYGFGLRDNWFLVNVMHQGARTAAWVVMAVLLIAIGWPVGVLRRLDQRGRVQLALTGIAALLAVSAIKQASHVSCPWDVQDFGGIAPYVSHWAWSMRDIGPGGCFPAGHASAAFACFGGYFVFRDVAPRVARGWLVAVLIAGLALGLAQQMRGAHFTSHTLWTAWVCWVVALIIDRAFAAARRSRSCSTSTLPFSR